MKSSRTTKTDELPGHAPLLGLPGVGPVTARRLATAGLERVEQLALFAPRRYDDAGALRPIGTVEAGERVYVEGQVIRSGVRRHFRRATLEVVIEDPTGRLLLRWFRWKGAVPERFQLGRRVRAAGVARAGKRGTELAQPVAEDAAAAVRLTGEASVRPRYAAIAGVGASIVEKLCARAARAELPEPAWAPPSLPTLSAAVRALHLIEPPSSEIERAALCEGRSAAHRRLAFEELLVLRLRARAVPEAELARPLGSGVTTTLAPLLAALPYAPTAAQRREIEALAVELARDRPMRRLLTGDVGSGKTLCAAAAFELAAAAGARGALLLPTVLLAEQQAQALSTLLAPTGRRVALLHGALPSAERRRLEARLAERAAPIDVVVGTHALLDESLGIAGLSLVIIDEQQRFGVAARARLVDQARREGRAPHQLALSATPIPRTLALALRGSFSLGHLDELPSGRPPIVTRILDTADAREHALAEIRDELATGGQVYWVCPQIDAGAARGAVEVGHWLSERLSCDVRVCHGRQPAATRSAQLAAFRAGAPILVATTVVEVGLDVPGATLMVVESPERLGLSTLHQLRGRVGRGARAGRCLLVAPLVEGVDRTRLDVLLGTNDGMAIAEADLARRGMGELAGLAQSGAPALPPLPTEDLAQLIEAADEAAARILEVDPVLAEPRHARLARARRSWSYDSA